MPNTPEKLLALMNKVYSELASWVFLFGIQKSIGYQIWLNLGKITISISHWIQATLNVGGNTISAQAMEHYILRKPAHSNIKEVHFYCPHATQRYCYAFRWEFLHVILKLDFSKAYQKGDKEDQEAIVHKLYGLELIDPNVTFALCCGTRSSPAVSSTN